VRELIKEVVRGVRENFEFAVVGDDDDDELAVEKFEGVTVGNLKSDKDLLRGFNGSELIEELFEVTGVTGAETRVLTFGSFFMRFRGPICSQSFFKSVHFHYSI